MNAIKIVVCGARGRMGRLVAECARQDPAFEVAGEVDDGDDLNTVIKGADVVIDFTTAAATLPLVTVAASHGKPMVVGTTGHTPEERARVLEAARGIPLVLASNFSTGVNILFHITRVVSELMQGADVAIEETHHTKKKDAPSGTAKSLQRIVEDVCGTTVPVESHRIGDVVGDHTISFSTTDEQLTLTHSAKDRATFARGALRAARWVIGKPAGLYDMQDVLGLKK